MIRWNKPGRPGGFYVVRFMLDNADEVVSLDPSKLSIYRRRLGPGNEEVYIHHTELADPCRIGQWAVRCNATGFVFFLPDPVYEQLFLKPR